MSLAKLRSMVLISVAAAALPLLAGCTTYGYASYGPPADEVEVYGVAPGPEFVWVGGYHEWDGHAYHWRKGSWAKPPRAGAHWEKGTWEQTNHGWRYHEGTWK